METGQLDKEWNLGDRKLFRDEVGNVKEMLYGTQKMNVSLLEN